jgi:hypothetical protein
MLSLIPVGASAMDVQLFTLRLQQLGQDCYRVLLQSAAKTLAYIASMSAVASSRVFGSATLRIAQTDNVRYHIVRSF